MRLRPARPSDAEPLTTLFTASFGLLDFLPRLHTPEEDRWFVEVLVLHECDVTVAESAGTLLGFIGRYAHTVRHLYVAPEAQGLGVGRRLLEHAKRREPRLELWCFAENLRARRFYERNGFRPAEETNGAGNEFGRPDIRYAWERNRPDTA
jgi:GNAT superfamily N-acetyltransferase